MLNFSFYVLRNRCSIAFNSCRANAFQYMKDVFELKENPRSCSAMKFEFSQVIELYERICQGSIKAWADNSKGEFLFVGHSNYTVYL